MSEYGISLFRVSPDDGDQDRDQDVPFPVSPSPVDGQDLTGIHPDDIDEKNILKRTKRIRRTVGPLHWVRIRIRWMMGMRIAKNYHKKTKNCQMPSQGNFSTNITCQEERKT